MADPEWRLHSLDEYHFLKPNRTQKKQPLHGPRALHMRDGFFVKTVEQRRASFLRIGSKRFSMPLDEEIR